MAPKPNPAASATATSQLTSSLRELHIGEKTSPITDIPRPKLTTQTRSLNTPLASKPKRKKEPVVADSWEDEVDSDTASDKDEEGSVDAASPSVPATSLSMSPVVTEGPLDPPPTPISPQTSQPWVSTPTSGGYIGREPSSASSRDRDRERDKDRRPEKQTAVAGRLIAGALGIRAPKRTEEQRAYDRAVKEQEIRRRNKEKEEAARLKEEEEKQKAAVWDS
ncbi:hypothetical protein BJY04DRAFT_75427 [Aspergillus karnatakaensis]|uniref:uncharacterized protein n=1 Tax=Aspergillus karnatakaensis TaxID=1810916 RepID=UPI003CCDAFF1